MSYDKQKYLREKMNPRCRERWRQKRKRKRQRRYFSYAAKTLRYKFRIQISAFDLWKIAKRQCLKCPLTGRHLTRENISIDHTIPLSSGGTNDRSNLRFVDYHANLAKASFSEAELLTLAKDIVKTLQ
jgi:5-methylcytosine-specific restriction endonuclease McrA